MSTKHTFEKMARNTWLAGLGSIESSLEMLSKSIDTAQEKSNSLYNEFLTKGEEIQGKIFDARNDFETKGKKLFGMGSHAAHEEQLARLNEKVEQLTDVVNKLLAEKEKSAKPAKPAAKTAKTVKPKAAPRPRRTAAVKKDAAKATSTTKGAKANIQD